MADIEGIDIEGVSTWFETNVDGARRPFTFELIAGGRSNLTYRVVDGAGHQYVLRRPPTSHVLPTAHDMVREHRIITALTPTMVPVAPVLGLCIDPSVNGAPFYVMGFVEGHILRDEATVEQVFSPRLRRQAGENLVDVLADLHAVDVDAIGLGELGRREGYIARQLKRWYTQYQQSVPAGTNGRTVIDEMHEFLAARVPEQGPPAIVHGDYRLDNTMLADTGEVAAVLDWELCTLGDPLADVGLLVCYWSEPGDTETALDTAPTMAPGFPTRDEIKSRYQERSGRDLSSIDFYVAFGYWKLACILQGILARYAGGAMGIDNYDVAGLDEQILRRGEMAREAAAKL
jgi:aminoglycoside phosphotransferase (APT) family kinase protein